MTKQERALLRLASFISPVENFLSLDGTQRKPYEDKAKLMLGALKTLGLAFLSEDQSLPELTITPGAIPLDFTIFRDGFKVGQQSLIKAGFKKVDPPEVL